MTSFRTARFRLVILMPVYRDWESASILCQSLDEQIARLPSVNARALLVDDGSPNGTEGWSPIPLGGLRRVDTLRLRRNIGHQRAICAGLCYVHEHMPCDAILVMDADGEDRPEDAARLIQLAIDKPGTVFFAERRKRFEGILFRFGYAMFRGLHHILTGIPVRVGNFSVIPFALLNRLTYMSELWNHYAGAIFKSKIGFERIRMDRGLRLKGRSQMDLVSLVTHGIAGIATFDETVATRMLIGNVLGFVALVATLAIVVGVRLWTDRAIPGWATYTTGLILIMLVQLMGVSFSLVFSLISNRTRMLFVPARDYSVFVEKLETLCKSQHEQ